MLIALRSGKLTHKRILPLSCVWTEASHAPRQPRLAPCCASLGGGAGAPEPRRTRDGHAPVTGGHAWQCRHWRRVRFAWRCWRAPRSIAPPFAGARTFDVDKTALLAFKAALVTDQVDAGHTLCAGC